MNSDQNWVEALKISPKSIAEWSMQVPANTPLLVWCLANGHVNCAEYLKWAGEHFSLPVLDTAFFHQSFDREGLTAFHQQAPWSAWCFPVGQWDDVTLVACAEPPTEMPEGKFAFVLADPAAMQEVWGATQTDSVLTETPVDAPIGINPGAPRTFVLNLDPNVTGKVADVLPPSLPTQEEKTEVSLSVVREPATDSKVSAAQPLARPAKSAPRGATAVNIQAETDIHMAFERLHENYQSALLMRCREGVAKPYKWDDQLPIQVDNEKFNVNLGFPSFFRIVAKTLQPYHGYVIDSPAHREFFANLNFENPPSCVTAIPLKTGEDLWGILVAFGGEAAQTTEALNQALAICEKLSASLGTTWSKAA